MSKIGKAEIEWLKNMKKKYPEHKKMLNQLLIRYNKRVKK